MDYIAPLLPLIADLYCLTLLLRSPDDSSQSFYVFCSRHAGAERAVWGKAAEFRPESMRLNLERWRCL